MNAVGIMYLDGTETDPIGLLKAFATDVSCSQREAGMAGGIQSGLCFLDTHAASSRCRTYPRLFSYLMFLARRAPPTFKDRSTG